MKPIQLTLVCHGQTEAQRVGRFADDDDPLREAPLPWPVGGVVRHVLSAPERRTRLTAQGLGFDAQIEEALRECDLGTWKGVTLKALQVRDPAGLQQWLNDPRATPHGGESIAELYARVAAWMDSALPPGPWLAVTHPFVIRAAMLHALRAPLTCFFAIDIAPLATLRLSHSGQWRLQLGD